MNFIHAPIHSVRLALALTLAAMAVVQPGSARAEKAAAPVRQPDLEIIYIPRADAPRAPGYDPAGVFLPLSELEALAAAALAPATEPTSPAPVSVSAINLDGRLDLALELHGAIDYIAPSNGWSAALIDDGQIAWTSQKIETTATTPTLASAAHLAKVNGRTYLFARGPARGRLLVESLHPPGHDAKSAELNFGRVFAPCYIDIELVRHDEIVKTSVPAEIYAGVNARRLSVWPSAGAPAKVALRQALSLQGDVPLGFSLDRHVRAEGPTLIVTDTIHVRGAFPPDHRLSLGLPPGLKLVEARPGDGVELTASETAITIISRSAPETLTFTATFAVPIAQGQATLTPWEIKADAVWGSLALASSPESTLSLLETPRDFTLTQARADERQWSFGSTPPPVTALVSAKAAALPPSIMTQLNLQADGSAQADVIIHQTTPALDEMILTLPDGWTPVGFSAPEAAPVTARRRAGSTWALSWPASDALTVDRLINARIRHVTSLDAGSSVTLRIPVVGVQGPRPERADWVIHSDDAIEVRVGALDQLEIAPPESMQPAPEPRPQLGLTLRATGPNPSGDLILRARQAETTATVVTALTLADNGAEVRALIRYSVNRVGAGVGVFHFVLPKSAGADVRIDAPDIREMTRADAEDGDLWTLTTQKPVVGDYDVTARWLLDPAGARAASDAARYDMPQIRLPETPSQRGFVIVEGSEALRVRMEPRGLAEADLEELPPLPWSGDRRALAVYRYTQPPFDLAIHAERVQPEPELEGLIPEAELTTTLLPHGGRLTQARYKVLPRGDRQFFELKLPEGAVLWSLLVNGRGEKPSRRDEDASTLYLAPLPPGAGAAVEILALYREPSPPLDETPRLNFSGPTPPFPVNRTIWKLNLPPGYEWLAFDGSLTDPRSERRPVASFLRTAYYPRMIVFDSWSATEVAILTAIGLFVAFAIWFIRRHARAPHPVFKDMKEAPEPRGCAGAMVQALIVLAVVAILAAIAVPNFLEAQVRSKVSRVRADQRSYASALEAYAVDYGVYPDLIDRLWQGSIKFLPGPLPDAFDPNPGSTLRYLTGDRVAQAALAGEGYEHGSQWAVYSVGPDTRDDGGLIRYDPTNGTTSPGDIVRTNQGFFSDKRDSAPEVANQVFVVGAAAPESAPAEAAPAAAPASPAAPAAGGRAVSEEGSVAVNQQETVRRINRASADQMADANAPERPEAVGEKKDQDSARETQIAQAAEAINAPKTEDDRDGADETRPTATQSATRTPGDGESQSTPGPVTLFASDGTTARSETIVVYTAPDAARHAGLLSLSIELPEGGRQRVFEALTGEARMEARLIAEKPFKRARFIIWILIAATLGAVHVLKPRLYGPIFIAALALSLLPPIYIAGASPAWFNAALQGVLFSLIVPAVTRFYRKLMANRPGERPSSSTTALLLLVVAATTATAPRGALALEGDAPDAPPVTVNLEKRSAPFPTPAGPARIIVPYNPARPPFDNATTPTLATDPIAFMSQTDFSRLWNLSHPDPRWDERPSAALTSLTLNAAFDPDSRLIRGTLTANLVNPGDVPTVIDVAEGQIQLQSAESAADDRAAWQVNERGRLQIRADARWSGSLRANVTLSPTVTGFSGALALTFADAAAGLWRIAFPYPDLRARVAGAPALAESRDGASVVTAPIRGGAVDLEWTASTAPTLSTAPAAWRAHADWNFSWTQPAFGFWTATVAVRSEPANAPLPAEIAFSLPAGMRPVRIDGPGVDTASVSGGDLLVRLRPASEAAFTLSGVALPTGPESWVIGGFNAPGAAQLSDSLTLSVAGGFTLREFTGENLRRINSGADSQRHESTGANWSAQLRVAPLRPVFDANIEETVRPREGFLFRSTRVNLSVTSGALAELNLRLPSQTRVAAVNGPDISSWNFEGDRIAITFAEPQKANSSIRITSVTDVGASTDEIHVTPLAPLDARDANWTLGVIPPDDRELDEAQIPASARPVPPTESLRSLSGEGSREGPATLIRAYAMSVPAELVFRLRPADARALLTVLNLTTVEEGLSRLAATVRVEPRKGRVHQIVLNALHGDVTPEQLRRIHAEGLVRSTTVEPISPEMSRVTLDLSAPQSEPFTIRLLLDRPASLDRDARLTPAALAPPSGSGGRAFVLLRRALEGELRVEDAAGARSIEPAAALAEAGVTDPARPSDQAVELSAAAARPPAFTLVRHAREQALRAVVELLRQTTTLSEDGFERHELEIFLQNQSEQFLKIALPAPRDRIALYEVRVADRVRRASFGQESGRDVLLVPLIRTGLLDPELVVRVAYTISGRDPLSPRGEREQRLPDVLGGVPVLQSQLILRLPSTFRYSDFDGTLEEIDLVDIETGDALRLARNIGKVSEVALTAGYETQTKAVGKLQEYMRVSAQAINSAKQLDELSRQRRDEGEVSAKKGASKAKLAKERAQQLNEAEQAQQMAFLNSNQLNTAVESQRVQARAIQTMTVPGNRQAQTAAGGGASPESYQSAIDGSPSAPEPPPVSFPSSGQALSFETFAFRQLQGTGAIHFESTPRKSAQRALDALTALAAIALAAAAFKYGRRLTASRRGAGLTLIVVGAIALALGALVDLAIPLIAAGLFLIVTKHEKRA